MDTIAISKIVIGERHRNDLGDIATLAASMNSVGLLHPVVVDTNGKLIAGARRLEAAKFLGWKHVAATVAKTLDDVHKALMAERDENTCRKDFTPTEAVEMAKALEPFEKKSAQQREDAGRKHGDEPPRTEKFTEREKGRAAEKVAAAVGMSRPTLTKAKAVVDAAKTDPKNYGDLPAKMDEKGKVDPVYEEMVERARKFPLPDGPTPAQLARRAPAVKWAKHIHQCWVIVNSIRDLGGIAKLAADWNDEERAGCLVELREFRAATDEWIRALETPCQKKKTA